MIDRQKEMLEHITIINQGEVLILESDYNVNGIYIFLKHFYEGILFQIFGNNDIKLITLNPGKQSLCNEIINNIQVNIGRDKLIISSIKSVSRDFLGDVISSLDFEVGKAIIIMDNANNIREVITNIYDWIEKQSERGNYTLKDIFCYCEADGYILYLVNTGLSISNLKL